MIRLKDKSSFVVIDLDGPDGNVMNILFLVERTAAKIEQAGETPVNHEFIHDYRNFNYSEIVARADKFFMGAVIFETSSHDLYNDISTERQKIA